MSYPAQTVQNALVLVHSINYRACTRLIQNYECGAELSFMISLIIRHVPLQCVTHLFCITWREIAKHTTKLQMCACEMRTCAHAMRCRAVRCEHVMVQLWSRYIIIVHKRGLVAHGELAVVDNLLCTQSSTDFERLCRMLPLCTCVNGYYVSRS